MKIEAFVRTEKPSDLSSCNLAWNLFSKKTLTLQGFLFCLQFKWPHINVSTIQIIFLISIRHVHELSFSFWHVYELSFNSIADQFLKSLYLLIFVIKLVYIYSFLQTVINLVPVNLACRVCFRRDIHM